MYKFDDTKHAHTFSGKPLYGTTTVLGVIAKPLTWWAAGKACEVLGWLNPKTATPVERFESAQKGWIRVREGNVTDYQKELDKAYRAHNESLDKSAKKGTDMHSQLERYVKHCLENKGKPVPTNTDRDPKDPVVIFAAWAMQNVKRFLFSEMHCYSEKMWTGGIIDCGFENMKGEYALLDFKSSKEVYYTHYLQNAGYDLQITENGGFDAEGNKVFEIDRPISYYAVLPYGEANPTVHTYHDTQSAKEGFIEALGLHKKLTSFNNAKQNA